MGWPQGWVEWVTAISFALTILAFPLAILGFRYARKQIIDTKTAAEAARDAASEAEDRFTHARLMLHLSLLRQVEVDLADTRRARDRLGVVRALRRWRMVAPTISTAVAHEAAVVEEVQESIVLARVAEEQIEADRNGDVLKMTTKAAASIGSTTDRINLVAEGVAHNSTSQVSEPARADLGAGFRNRNMTITPKKATGSSAHTDVDGASPQGDAPPITSAPEEPRDA